MTIPTSSAAPAGQPTPTPPAEPPKPAPPAPAAAEPTTPPAGDPPKGDDDKPLGEGGLKALQAERARADELEKQVKALAPLQKLAEALGTTGDSGAGKTEIEQITERLAQHETELKTEKQARWRAEIAAEKGLTIQQAARLVGTSKEELAADADALAALFPTAPAAPGTPKPDPSQGGQGGTPPDLDAQIAEAQGKGDVKAVLRLQNQKLANAKR
ncbi:hypothetical protein VSH64_24900 [Amycolatopsis rhabdoformis]|uniref:Scaffolding protein n=1 Tax=Amycolatopsis rhabdoformis TaxID=1448059 RepID=A0ABZ1HX40_9PSEU|nr:hypothetical protein [Amycolatopsis rhabdoformis]WSE26117.1 hypothetical protein VSH64_24900 [Amycolatopsis rhabdoformis]